MIFLLLKIILLFSVFGLLYMYSSRNYDYWDKKKVPYVKPAPVFGNLLDLFKFRKSFPELLACYYNKYRSPYFGIYFFDKPCLVIRDPTLIKNILVKDFQNFNDHYVVANEKCDSLVSNMLFFMKNPEWKFVRARMTPIFTPGKMKNMFSLIKDAGGSMILYLNKHVEDEFIEAKEVCGKYSTDVIASCAFGLHSHSFETENAPFRVVTRKMFNPNWKTELYQMSYFVCHWIVKLFKMPFFDIEVSRFLRKAFWETIEERERSKNVRHDVIDVITKFKDKTGALDNIQFHGDRLLAQVAQFFTAGLETVSSTIAFVLYELSLHPEIQDKVRLEIKNAILKHKEINYTAIQSMNYLSMVVTEALRKYPVLPFLERLCVNDYQIPNESFIIEKGTSVYVSLLGLHYNPDYFSNPKVFNPERFASNSNENCITYLPFGEGPRNCIGKTFGLLTIKTGLVEILTEFRVELTSKTPTEIHFSPYSLLLASSVGIPLKFKKVNVCTRIH